MINQHTEFDTESKKVRKISEAKKQEMEKISKNLHEIADKALAKYSLL